MDREIGIFVFFDLISVFFFDLFTDQFCASVLVGIAQIDVLVDLHVLIFLKEGILDHPLGKELQMGDKPCEIDIVVVELDVEVFFHRRNAQRNDVGGRIDVFDVGIELRIDDMHGDERRFLFVDFHSEVRDHHVDDIFRDLVFIFVEIAHIEGKHRIETDAVIVPLDAGIDMIGQRHQYPLGDLPGTAADDVIRRLDSELHDIIGDLVEKGSQGRIDAFAL